MPKATERKPRSRRTSAWPSVPPDSSTSASRGPMRNPPADPNTTTSPSANRASRRTKRPEAPWRWTGSATTARTHSHTPTPPPARSCRCCREATAFPTTLTRASPTISPVSAASGTSRVRRRSGGDPRASSTPWWSTPPCRCRRWNSTASQPIAGKTRPADSSTGARASASSCRSRLADGSIYDPRQHLYPSGFTPQFSGDVIDHAIQAGVRAEAESGFTVDLSASRGIDEIRYRIANTMNPSMGPDTADTLPTGQPGQHRGRRQRRFRLAVERRARRSDQCRLRSGIPAGKPIGSKAGDPASYQVGPFARPDPFNFEVTQAEVDADPDDELTGIECRIPGFEAVGSLCPTGDPVNNTVPIGSNGFPGYPPAFSSELVRRSRAAYVDVEGGCHAPLARQPRRSPRAVLGLRGGGDLEVRDPLQVDGRRQPARLGGHRLSGADAGTARDDQRPRRASIRTASPAPRGSFRPRILRPNCSAERPCGRSGRVPGRSVSRQHLANGSP